MVLRRNRIRHGLPVSYLGDANGMDEEVPFLEKYGYIKWEDDDS